MLIAAIDAAARETTLFAAIWFLIGGIDDFLIDLIYAARLIGARFPAPPQAQVSPVAGRMAVFIAAWDEAPVIGVMLRTALARFDHPDYRLYVGTYPNDPATIAAVADIAATDARVRLVIGDRPGPTTKADNLNTLWRALLRDEAEEGFRVLGIALHDAEDVVHPLELRVQAQMLARHDAVQLPVLPLPHPDSRWVSGHYLDEFAESHAKTLLVRRLLGAGLPLAGVGCAIRRDMLARIAALRGGKPFDAASLTEDYELGLTIGALGGTATLARVAEGPSGRPVAVRAYFPATFRSATRQKARWMTGIALAGWDRIGWAAPGQIGDHWMRMRDRRATLAMPVLAIAYCAMALCALSFVLHLASSVPSPAATPLVAGLLWGNFAMVGWRLAVRGLFVRQAYGWREALRSVPRAVVANIVALAAARRAIVIYVRLLRGGALHWDKTAHQFPDAPDEVAA